MKDEEKNLIENLFHRLKNTELNSSERDDEADILIQDLVKKQPHSSYYMVQTMLIQETAIKKMSLKIEELENKISTIYSKKTKNKTSFLSNFFKKDSISPKISHDNNIWKKNQNITEPSNGTIFSSPSSTITNSSGNSSFLRNALQTATGVAGGMILGNMLMNVFNHTKPEDEIFDTISESSISHLDESNFHENVDNSLINYDDQSSIFDSSENISNAYEVDEDSNDSDFNDDNLI
ncbi:DUF2076 domain-containing protein [Buchnera aphidicola (Melanaphis sacchari)]|uniref:DUF2076 domain-containing protein n=1 Tax=Buchnera aphidicola (Melanaphis sacchari) TaxID=2173854 RepID=A0A2U8DFK7_9GAMM|nr:DUF2076 domain-containing protein [Buchnera aphidicola]AWH90588.1 DUF2076 domain-containing protein [Buchnera aphidicola (Melanaphis sacchari)]